MGRRRSAGGVAATTMAAMPDDRRPIDRVTVYCSSSNELHPDYFDAADRLGRLLAAERWGLVYGGGSVGLMGRIASAVRGAGGHVTGIITQRLRDAEQMDDLNDENVVVDTMRERKRLLEARGDAFVILPGGLGTLEEFFEILVGHLLGEHGKPIVVLNLADPDRPGEGFYDPLLGMFDHMVASRMARPGVMELFEVVRTPEQVVASLREAERRPASTGRLDLVPTPPVALRREGGRSR